MSPKKTCFVVMGFGMKTDYATGRVLNLDASYQNIIKPAVEAAGLTCIRADEIVHTGIIDIPMYEQLLEADVVVADLSTSNTNAFYELGVRHALRPYTTIVIAEDQLKYPFDVNHLAIRSYKHLGEDVGVSEAKRFIGVLKTAIETVVGTNTKDSPVYAFLKDLNPPAIAAHAQSLAAMAGAAGLTAPTAPAAAPANAASSAASSQAGAPDPTLSTLMSTFAALKGSSQFAAARDVLKAAHALSPVDSYVIQQLALTTYKAKQPDPVTALNDAKKILETLCPHATSDPETLGLWGAIHKRLWELGSNRADLDEAIQSYEKGFYVKNDYYNGINVAFLLNLRASISPPADAIADWVDAERIRKRVIATCEMAIAESPVGGDDLYWMEASIAEAWLGLGDKAKHDASLARAFSFAGAGWMKDSTTEQLGKLSALLETSPLRFIRD